MRNLAIDIGNSKIKTGLFDAGTLIETRSFGTTSFGTASPELKGLVAAYQPDSAIVASVVDIHPEFIAWLQQHTHLHFFPGELRLPLENNYRTPETLGADRLAAVIGAGSSQVLSQPIQAATSLSDTGSPRLVIAAGTCITYNFVNGRNQFLGGAISPGLHMRLQAMHTFTGKLPLITLDEGYQQYLGTDTRESMLAGAQEGAMAELTQMIASYDKQYPGLQVFLCGGDAEFFDKRLKNSIFADRVELDRDLILKGLDRVLNFQYQ